jgi:hypothetical protein
MVPSFGGLQRIAVVLMLVQLPLFIFLLIIAGCAPAKYIVRNADADYLFAKMDRERLVCIGGIPIGFGEDVPYGLQQSINYKTKGTVPSVWVDVRTIVSKALVVIDVNRAIPCKRQNVESLLIKDIKHEYEFDIDTGAAIFSAKLRSRVMIGCKDRGSKTETILKGEGPPVSGGFFGSTAADEKALARSTTYAVYDLLSKAQEICNK